MLGFIKSRLVTEVSTVISGEKYLIPSDLRSQIATSVVSTAVGDHAGTPRTVLFSFFFLLYSVK
jgi:hypothetical protein